MLVFPSADQFQYLLQPAIVLASVSTIVVARLARTTMLEVGKTDYMRTARAKGLRERRVTFHHGLRNAIWMHWKLIPASILIRNAPWLLLAHETFPDIGSALRAASFHVVSVATTTGYASADYALWPVFAPVWLMFLGTFVSCAGSTGGGIKMVRMVLLIKQARRELVRAIHPRVVNPIVMGRAPIAATVIASVMAYMLIYGATTIGLTMLMLISGLDIVTAFSAVVATVNNIGPGLGQVGPASNFGVLTDFQTWVCTVAMLMGRLELLAVMVLFAPQFWRK